jgi:membrane protein
MMGLMRTFDRSLPVYVKRSNLNRRWTAIKLTLLLMIMTLAALGSLVIQSSLVNRYLLKITESLVLVKTLSLVSVIIFLFLTISLIFRYGPSLKAKFPLINRGSIFATLGIIVVTYVFFAVVVQFINYNKVYGPIGTLIAFMVWIWLNTLLLLIGYEINVGILMTTEQKKGADEV